MLGRDAFHARFGDPALFGMVHLLPLPGAPLWAGSLAAVIERARRDASILEEAGFDGLVVENFGDRPFSKRVEPETVAAMTVVVDRIMNDVGLPIGVNVLRNDPLAALGIAAATSVSFIRINVHIGTMDTDQGIIEGSAAETLRHRRSLGIDEVALFTDLLVKHARPVVTRDPVEVAMELRDRGLADAILVTGSRTGAPVEAGYVKRVREIVEAPLVIASGVSDENIQGLASLVDGFIIGTSIKEQGVSDAPVDRARALRIVSLVK